MSIKCTVCGSTLIVSDSLDIENLIRQQKRIAELEAELAKMQQWVNDLQSGMYINCVYCGHRYGPREDTPVAMADVLKEHIEKCPKHPMSKLKSEKTRLMAALQSILDDQVGIWTVAKEIARQALNEEEKDKPCQCVSRLSY